MIWSNLFQSFERIASFRTVVQDQKKSITFEESVHMYGTEKLLLVKKYCLMKKIL